MWSWLSPTNIAGRFQGACGGVALAIVLVTHRAQDPDRDNPAGERDRQA